MTNRVPWSWVGRGWSAPLLFATLVVIVHLIVVWPVLAANHRDVSVFVQAGSSFVDTARLRVPIAVLHGSAGYDGQFYYRMAVAPFSFKPVDHGIRFDAPSYRSQRFMFPLLAWLVSFGRPGGAAASLFAVNLLGIGAIAFLSLLLTRALRMTPAAALAIAFWPGFLVALTHDTSEIVAEAFLLGAVLCYARQRWAGYALLGVAATLTRETTAIVLGGLLLDDGYLALRRGTRRVAATSGLLLLAPVVAWHEALPHLWHETAGEGVFTHDLGWPLVGVVEVLHDRLAALSGLAALPMQLLVWRLLNLVTTVALLAFCVAVACRVPASLRRGGEAGSLAVAWMAVALFMSLLTAGDGPWVTPTEFCRAFSECWVVGCLVLCAGRWNWMAGRRWLPLVAWSTGMWLAVLLHVRWAFGLHLRLL